MRRRSGRPHAPAWILLAIFVVSLPAVTTRIYASDEIEYYAWLRSVAFDRDVNFQNEYLHFYDAGGARDAGFHETFLETRTEAGHLVNFAPIGSALLWAPFFAVGHLVAIATGASADGFSHPYIASIAYASAVYGLFALLLTLAIVRRLVGDDLRATLVVWLGTPLVFYMYVAPGFAHATSAFAVSLCLWCWLRVRRTWTPAGAIALGAAGALMAMVREQDALVAVAPAIDFLWWAWRMRGQAGHWRRAAATGIAGAVAWLAAYTPQLAAYHALNGHFGPTHLVARKMTWSSPHFFQVLLSPEHGFFIWTPLAVVALAGLGWLAVARRQDLPPESRYLAVLALLLVALQVYINGCVESWTVAGSFGQRRFVALTPLLAVGLAAMSRAWGSKPFARVGYTLVLVGGLWWNLGLMAQFGLHTMDRQRLTPMANARATFIDLPIRAPALVWRYLTDRSSFYGLPRR
jgi:hypothetical protein